MYSQVFAYGRKNGVCAKMFPILSGIIQGCPLAGSLFALLLDPYLAAMRLALGHDLNGIVRACADDIATALPSINTLKRLYPIFMQAERFASLCLQTAKTCIVPVATAISPELIETIRVWLSLHTPRWTGIKIQGSAKYLGFYLGPTAAFHGWNNQRRKWSNRTKAIARSGVPLQPSILAYQTRALTTLSYIAQLVPPPKKIFPQER